MNKDKYLQIFNYLLEFSKLRSNPVRDIESSDQYPERIWLADILQCEIFDCVTFSDYNQKISKPKEPKLGFFQDYNQDADYWLKIIQYPCPKDMELH
jgi:hypothetical protein